MEYLKSDTISTCYKDKGNKELMKRNLKNALLIYNKALRYAKSKEMLALIYANRSVIYLQEKLYDECLSNIQWARENGYPAEKIQKLNEREEKCKKLMKNYTRDPAIDPWNFFKLSYPANPQVPFIANCLEMRKTEKYGRGIYATRDLKSGDIVAIEDIVVHSIINKKSFEMSCAYCSKGSQLNFIPCLKTTRYLFCSLECRENCYAKIHEADLMNENHRMFVYARVLIYLENIFGGTDKLMKYFEDKLNSKHEYSVFDFDFSNPNDPEYNRNLFKCFLSSDYKNSNEIIETAMSSWQSKKQTCATLSRVDGSNKLLKSILLVWSFLANTKDYFNLKGYSFVNLLNHSCVPNVHRFELDTKSMIYVIRPIKAGEQLFVSYQWLTCFINYFQYAFKDIIDPRKDILTSQYKFNCDCYACTHGIKSFIGQFVTGDAGMLLGIEKALMSAIKRKNFKPALEKLEIIHKVINEHPEGLVSFDIANTEYILYKIIENFALIASYPFDYEWILQESIEA